MRIGFAAHFLSDFVVQGIIEEVGMRVKWDGEGMRVRHIEAREERVDIGRLRERNRARNTIATNFKTQKPPSFTKVSNLITRGKLILQRAHETKTISNEDAVIHMDDDDADYMQGREDEVR